MVDAISHPVHLVTAMNQKSPSAFIPFCEFGGNMSTVGEYVDLFDVPVCNSFQAKTLNDQLCYEVDLNNFSDKNNIYTELRLGFNFLMDYNEDRQVAVHKTNKSEKFGLANSFVKSDQNQHAFIYLDTIGIKKD